MKKINLLFVYPNRETVLRIPMAISILCSAINKAGHNIRIFDTTFLGDEFKTDVYYSEKKGTVKKSKLDKYIGDLDNRPLDTIVKELVSEFHPDLIAVSLLERNYTSAMKVIEVLKKYNGAPVLVGGIMPTISPEVVINTEGVDMICIGEGEGPLVDLCNAVAGEKPLRSIPNLWIKEDGYVHKNALRPLIDINTVPEQDWEPFDKRHFYRAYKGEVYRNGSFEFARGCTKMCSFCVAPKLRETQKNLGKYHRFKNPEFVIEEIVNKVKKYNLNLIHFGDTDFLFGMKASTLKTFAELYKKYIELPFLIQTGADAITEEKMKLLKIAGCDNISIGVESGSEKIRKQVLNKHVSNKRIVEAFRLGRKYKVRITANYMLGLPDETEEDILDTIKFNRLVNPPAISVFFFTPFIGTKLYDHSLAKGYIKGFNPNTNLHKESPLQMPHLPKKRISELMQHFVDDFDSYKDIY